MKPQKPRTPRQELEASLTALLLGELPADKAAALRELMAKDAELARLYERLEQTIGLVRETAVPAEQGTQSAPLKLSKNRREQLLQHFKTIAPREFTKPERRKTAARELAIAAGIVAFIGVAAWFMFNLTQESYSSTARIKVESPSAVSSATEPATARLAAEQAAEIAQDHMVAIMGSAGGGSAGIARPSQTIFDAPSSGKPVANQVVLPVLRDPDIYGNDFSLPTEPRKSSVPELSHEIAFRNQSVQSASARPTERPLTLSVSTNYVPIAGTADDPQWVGVFERGNYSPGLHSTNQFVSRSASIAVPTNKSEFVEIASLPYQPRSPVLTTNGTYPSNFAYYQDLNRNGRFDLQGSTDSSSASGSQPTAGFGRTGTGANWGPAGPQQQNDEMLRRQAGGLAWEDNMQQKNGNTGLADGSSQEFRRKLQEMLVNRAASAPVEQPPVIDPATGLPMPVTKAELQDDDIGGLRTPTPSAMPTRPRTLREAPAQTPAASTPIAGEKLTELAQEGKDASGSNIYLGKELAKADVLQGSLTNTLPRNTKVIRDGFTIAGRAATPNLGFGLLGPKETPPPSGVPIDSQSVTSLGDLPTLGKAFKGAELKSEQARGGAAASTDWNFTPSEPTNLLANRFYVREGLQTQTNWVRNFTVDGGALTAPGTNPTQEHELVTRQSMVDIEKEWLNPSSFGNSNATKSQAGTVSNVYSLEIVGYSPQQPGGRIMNSNPLVGTNSYDSNTQYRLVEQLGTEANKETKLALNYSNVTDEDRKRAGKSSVSETREEIIPPGTIDFRGADVNQVLDLYSELTGRKILAASNLPSAAFVLPNRSMTKTEAIETLDLMLATNGIAVVDIGDKFAKAAPVASAGQMGAAFNNRQAVLPRSPTNGNLAVNETGVQKRDGTSATPRLREEYKIADAMAPADAPSMLMSAESLRKLEGMRIELEAQAMQQEAVLEKVKKMPREKFVYALPTAIPDTLLNSLLEQKNLVEQSLLVKQKELGESSSEVAKLRSQVSDLNSKIDTQADGILMGLDARVASTKEQLGKLRDEVEKAKTIDIAEAKKAEPYLEARRKLDELQQVSQALQMKIASENIEASLPKTTMVEIMDDAVPAKDANVGLWDRMRGKGKYESQARIKLERDQTDIAFATDPRMGGASYDPYFIQNEFETIQSDKVLGNVVEAYNLQKEWAKGGQTLSTNQAIALLKQKLDLKPVRNTSFVDIGVKSDKPAEAAELANAIARSYQGHRLELRRELSLAGVQGLEQRWKEQEEKVREAQKEVDKLRSAAVINQTRAVASQPLTNQQVDVVPPKPAVPPPVPQPEVQTREKALSTFSLNVSDVAFKLAAASLEKGQMPEASSIRSEEFINAFDYRDPEAPAGVPVAFAWERARYPYAQNRDLLRFSIKTAAQGRQAGRPLNLVLLMDNSGSMERADRVAIIREALKVLASQLQPQDKFSVITFARTAQLRVDGVAGNQALQVAEDIGGLTPEGGTNIEEAMNLAYQTALRHYLAIGINRVVLLTDGAANLGNVEPESLKQKVEANRKQGVALDCFGIGWEGFNDDLLETLSRNGDGRYGFINSPEEAATEFAGQLAGALNVAASDVKVQVEFNPARVTAYRQIGYAKHQLTKEQFRDNTVDAAEIAAQEAGNALYVIEVNPAGQGPLGTVRVRFKVPGTSDYREHEWTVPFNSNAVGLEQASPAMRLAATASAFSEWLASSPYATEVTPDTLLRHLSGVPEVYGADGRPKKLEWMIRQAKSVAGGEIRNSTTDEHR